MTLSRGVMERAFGTALAALPTRPEDAAVIALGRRLARLIDNAQGEAAEDPASGRDGAESMTVLKLANQYLAVLVQLGATPHARSQMFGKLAPTQTHKPKTPLEKHRDELAERRADRSSG